MDAQYWKPFKNYKVKITLDDPDSNHLQLKSYEFNLELRDICADNTITKNAELAESTVHIIDAADTSLTPDFTILTTTHNCISSATLNFLDTVTNKYVQDNTGTTITGSPYAFTKTFSTTNGALVVSTSDIAKYAIQKNFKAMITVTLTESLTASSKLVYYFEVIIRHKCALNELTLSSDLGYQIYYIDTPNTDALDTTGNKLITPSVTKTVAVSDCPLTCTIEQYNKSKQIWELQSGSSLEWSWLKAFATSNTAEINVWTSDVAKYHP